MKVLVTGAAGFLGRRVVRRLLENGDNVRCLVRPGTDTRTIVTDDIAALPGSLEIVRGSLGHPNVSDAAVRGCEVVYHLAAAMTGCTAVLFTNNVTATRELMRSAAAEKVRRFVLVSSLGVYGTHGLRRGDALDETCPLDPKPQLRDPYTFSKVIEERVAREVEKETGLSLVIVRPGVIYGPGRGILSGRVGLQFGNWLIRMGGRQVVPYTYVDNVADAIARAGTAQNCDGQAINVVDDDPPRARQLVKRHRRNVGKLRVLPIPHWAIGPVSGLCERYHVRSRGQLPAVLTRYKSEAMWKRLTYSNQKAKSLLNWRPIVSFEEGLTRATAR